MTMLLVSLVAHAPEPYEIVVATDRPERYAWFGTRIEIEYLDPSLLTAWKGPDPFSMRQKLALLRAAWPDQGHIVLLDADVLARSPLTAFVAELATGRLFMSSARSNPSPRSRRARRMSSSTRRIPRRRCATITSSMDGLLATSGSAAGSTTYATCAPG